MFASRFTIAGVMKRNSLSRIVPRAALLPACLAIFGCASTMQTMPGAPQTPAVIASAKLSFCDHSAADCATSSTFSLASLRNLNVLVTWQNVPAGTHAQTVHVFLPDGNLYQSLERSFAIPDPAAAVNTVGSASTVQALPVAGTFITQRGLTGAWQVTLDLDGQAMAAETVTFTQ